MNYIFSAAFMANSLSMTGLLIALSLAGYSDLSADVAIVQAATLALFFAFSANARNLILKHHSTITAQFVLSSRIPILIPLAVAAYWLSAEMAAVPPYLAGVLILRRAVEWLDEVYLSEVERLDAKKAAARYLFIQTALLATSFLWIAFDFSWPIVGLLLWALFPLSLSLQFYRDNLPTVKQLFERRIFEKLLPHIGSTMIIGITVYIFRLLIIMVTGKSNAGDLFTAFAIGGLLGSVFANSVGPSLALHQKRNFNYRTPIIIKLLLGIFFTSGIALASSAYLQLEFLALSHKSYLFWFATGLSMIAGTVMVFAQMIRHRLLQHHQEQDLFGPDVMMNILIIAAVPFSYYLFGLNMMAALYLLSAILAYLFYASYEFGEGLKSGLSNINMHKFKIIILALILIPVFFQIDGGIFNDKSLSFDSHGQLRLLPMPLSVIGCFLGILVLGNYQQAKFSFTFIFLTFVLMTFATIITTGKSMELEQSKFIFLLQFIMPMFGLVLGQFFYQRHGLVYGSILGKTWLFLLLIFTAFQLVCTWLQGYYFLTPYLYVVSVYQYLQYVPTVLVSAFLLTFISLWNEYKYKRYLELLMILMGLYVVASLSISAISMFFIGVFFTTAYIYINFKDKRLVFIALLTLVISGMYFHYSIDRQTSIVQTTSQSSENSRFIHNQTKSSIHQRDFNKDKSIKSGYDDEIRETYENKDPELHEIHLLHLIFTGFLQKPLFWQTYYKDIVQDPKTVLFGHAEKPSREVSPSAHNYYLDFIYNYGLIAFVPFIFMVYVTIKLFSNLLKSNQVLDKKVLMSTITLFTMVFFLLIGDNFFKVGLRQPYPGIFTFFLWGMLVSKLFSVSSKVKHFVNK